MAARQLIPSLSTRCMSTNCDEEIIPIVLPVVPSCVADDSKACHSLAGDRGESLTVEPVQVTLRRGLAGYDGVSDTYIRSDSTAGNEGADPVIHCKENSYSSRRVLLRFDLTSIPQHMLVSEATLDLYLTYCYPARDWTISVYPMSRAWDEGGATWTDTGLGATWAVAGAGGDGVDRDDARVMVSGGDSSTGIKTVDITDLVNAWVQHPEMNNGLLIVGTSADVRFSSSEVSRDGERPSLNLTYAPDPSITPGPTATLTPSPTPTQAPAATPTPANVVYSIGRNEAFDPLDEDHIDCIEAGPIVSSDRTDHTNVLLVWEGMPTQASLSFKYAGNNRHRHSVLVNGQIIGQLPGDNWSSVCTGGSLATLVFDPSLVVCGENTISILDDGGTETSSWSLQDPRIALGGMVQATEIVSITLDSSFDPSTQRSMIQKPIGYQPGAGDVPLVVALHGWGGRDFDALRWMAEAANEKGWLLAASDTRNDNQHTPGKAVQSDINDLLDYMIASSEYSVDEDRIYIVGSSMGGMMAATMAAVWPDRFAAMAELKGPTRLDNWYWEMETWRQNEIRSELNGTPSNIPFTYQRKSSAAMPGNLRNVPTLIVHGTEDQTVPYSHAQDLYAGLSTYGDVYLYPYPGGHADDHPDWSPSAILDWFSQYSRVETPTQVTVRCDRPNKSFYWLDVDYVASDHWTWVDASYDLDTSTINVDVHDERATPLNVDITLNLAEMGLPTHVDYTVEDVNLHTGYFTQSTEPAGNTLVLSVYGDKHRFTAYPFSAPSPQEVMLRQGVNGYTGASDTYLSEYWDMDINYDATDPLKLTTSGSRRALLRFGLDPLPSSVVIKSARLSIYSGGKDHANNELQADVFRMIAPWDPTTVTWNQPSTGASWGQVGASLAGTDYDASVVASQELDAVGAWYDYNVTDLVQGWRDGSYANNGVMIRGDVGSGTFSLSSAESGSTQPQLAIVYTEPTITPTPTTSPTPSPSPTATSAIQRVALPILSK